MQGPSKACPKPSKYMLASIVFNDAYPCVESPEDPPAWVYQAGEHDAEGSLRVGDGLVAVCHVFKAEEGEEAAGSKEE
ncbi:hypothetical protein V502_07240 [Pseudogymnoascus sp. VKM F-4520 (FW-2644)]|nr:hypothetical protein V502_07240 [Pseudogymnoascus sp. VKM F-4520 (FW-2644)]